MPNVTLTDFDTKAADIERRRKYAEMLSQQGAQPLDPGQMAGGRVVPISWTQMLAKGLDSGMGAYQQRKAADEMKALGEEQRQARSGDMQRLIEGLRGAPAQPEQWMSEGIDERLQPAVPERKAGQLDPSMIGQLRTPEAQQMAMAQILAQMKPKDPIKMGKDERLLDPETKATLVGPVAAPPKWHVVGGNLVQEPTAPGQTVKPAFTAPDKDAGVWSDPYDLGGAQVQKNSRTGEIRQAVVRPPVTNNVTTVNNAGPRAFETELGKLDAEQLGKWRDNALSGQQTLGIVENLRSAAKSGVFSGGGAQAKTAVASWINGITGATPKNAVGSELFNAEASKLVLEKVKSLGANPSNADREFIEKTVPQLTNSPQARDALVDFLERKARASISLYQSADSHARKNNGLKGFNMFPDNSEWKDL